MQGAGQTQELAPIVYDCPEDGSMHSLPSATTSSKLASSCDFGVVQLACQAPDVKEISYYYDIVKLYERVGEFSFLKSSRHLCPLDRALPCVESGSGWSSSESAGTSFPLRAS